MENILSFTHQKSKDWNYHFPELSSKPVQNRQYHSGSGRPGFVRLDSRGEQISASQKLENSSKSVINSSCGTKMESSPQKDRHSKAEKSWFGNYSYDKNFDSPLKKSNPTKLAHFNSPFSKSCPNTSKQLSHSRSYPSFQMPFNLNKGQYEHFPVYYQEDHLPVQQQLIMPEIHLETTVVPQQQQPFQYSQTTFLSGTFSIPDCLSSMVMMAANPVIEGFSAAFSAVRPAFNATARPLNQKTAFSSPLNPNAKSFVPLNPNAKEFQPSNRSGCRMTVGNCGKSEVSAPVEVTSGKCGISPVEIKDEPIIVRKVTKLYTQKTSLEKEVASSNSHSNQNDNKSQIVPESDCSEDWEVISDQEERTNVDVETASLKCGAKDEDRQSCDKLADSQEKFVVERPRLRASSSCSSDDSFNIEFSYEGGGGDNKSIDEEDEENCDISLEEDEDDNDDFETDEDDESEDDDEEVEEGEDSDWDDDDDDEGDSAGQAFDVPEELNCRWTCPIFSKKRDVIKTPKETPISHLDTNAERQLKNDGVSIEDAESSAALQTQLKEANAKWNRHYGNVIISKRRLDQNGVEVETDKDGCVNNGDLFIPLEDSKIRFPQSKKRLSVVHLESPSEAHDNWLARCNEHVTRKRDFVRDCKRMEVLLGPLFKEEHRNKVRKRLSEYSACNNDDDDDSNNATTSSS